MTPFVESPTGRLTELVYLLADRPLSLVHQAVLEAEADVSARAAHDPWLVVASALHRLSTMTEATVWVRHQERQLAHGTAQPLVLTR